MTYQDSNRLPISTKLLTKIFSNIKVSAERSYNGSPCWEWQRAKNGWGYGYIYIPERRQTVRVHRLTYQLFVAIIPSVKILCDHLCRVRHCCNPAHIELVDHRTNTLRGTGVAAQNAIKKYCNNGHPFSGSNLRFYGSERVCKACQDAAAIRHRERRRDKERLKETAHNTDPK